MAKRGSYHEIEIKLRVQDLRAMRGRLKRLGAREISPRTHESNTLYDTPAQNLRRTGRLIRIRIERVAAGSKTKQAHRADDAILTYKAPARSLRAWRGSHIGKGLRSRFKIKEEAEVSFAGSDAMRHILLGLGLSPQFRYEKYRTTYILSGIRDAKIELDETPIGNYLELEGSPAAIDRAATALGYAASEYIRETYGALFLAYCARRGRKPGDMLFSK